MLRNILCQNVSIIFSYYLCSMYCNIYGVEHVAMQLCANMIFTSVNLAIYTGSLQCLLNFIECLDKENEKYLSSALVLNASYSCRF